MTTLAVAGLTPLSIIYGAVARARLMLYGAGVLATHRIDAPVISVGNITAGGAGKTPLVAWLARRVAQAGHRACILTRGYGRADVGKRVVVSDGEHVLADVREGGDEPCLLAELLLGAAAVISDRDRVAAARWALKNFGSEIFILDDGFQHLRIARDLNIAVLDATDPWGGGNLLPAGRLREPPAGLARADCIVITRADMAHDLDALCAEAKRFSGGRAVVLTSRMRTLRARPLSSTCLTPTVSPVESVSSAQPVGAFCALGNPRAFFEHLRNDGYISNYQRAFPDHHTYRQADVDALVREAGERGARALLTTAKDAVKLRSLRFALPCYVVEIALDFADEDRMGGIISEALSRRAKTRLK